MTSKIKTLIVLILILVVNISVYSQDTISINKVDSNFSTSYKVKSDSVANLQLLTLKKELDSLKNQNKIANTKLQKSIADNQIAEKNKIVSPVDSNDMFAKKRQIDSLRSSTKGYPVIGVMKDTLFLMYSKIGASSAKERAQTISKKIRKLYDNDFLKVDSIEIVKSENTLDIVYGDLIITSVSDIDAIWHNKSTELWAKECKSKIINSIVEAKKQNSTFELIKRILLVCLVFFIAWFIIFLIRKLSRKLLKYLEKNKQEWIQDLAYKDYTFLSAEQELGIIMFLFKIIRWFIYLVLAYITIPVIFSFFPFTRGWADELINLVWSPVKSFFMAIVDYLPNLFSIIVIYILMVYFIRFVKYIFSEIRDEKLKISGFHSDWAMPTYSIIKFILYSFMFVLIFPYLPGSNSNIFRGVSVFIGVLFSLGSSSAIANIVAGLVITYMRPFKIGDRIKIGEISGDVVEKTLLVTRLKTIKNEEITIPNSSVLSGNTTNYSSIARTESLIIHTTITIGYDVAWKEVHQALLNAADRTEFIMKEPKPFVLQTSLDDFYVAYQINAHTKDVNKQAVLYSNLHQNIQDCCAEMGIEILSPHYRAERDGTKVAIPESYFLKDEN